MSATLVDVLLTLFTAAGVLGLAGTGVLALPWRDGEIEASWRAWRVVGAMPAAAIGAVSVGLGHGGARSVDGRHRGALRPRLVADAPADALLPAALPRPRRDASRARRLGHVALHDAPRRAAGCAPRPTVRCEATPAPLV